MKRIIILILIHFTALGLFADNIDDMTMSSELFLQISSRPGAKLGFTQSYIFPFLQGSNPLTEGNNIKFDLTAEVTPISINGIFEAVLTPIAFIELSAGGRAGAGWPLSLFDSDAYGTGLNVQGDDGNAKYKGSAFDALLWKVFAGGTFQFDLAAIFPGDWNHIVFRTYHEINYHANTNAGADEAWYFEDDDGENINGLNYYGNFVIGYQMPIFLSMIAILTEMDLFLYDTPGRSAWGDDLILWKFSGALEFTITEKFKATLIAQFKARRNFTNYGTSDSKEGMYYRNRILDTSNPLRLELYQIALMLTYKL